MRYALVTFMILLSFVTKAYAFISPCVKLSEVSSRSKVIDDMREYFDLDYICDKSGCDLSLESGRNYKQSYKASDFEVCRHNDISSYSGQGYKFAGPCEAGKLKVTFRIISLGKIFDEDYEIDIFCNIYNIDNPEFYRNRCSFESEDEREEVIEDLPPLKDPAYFKIKRNAFTKGNFLYEYDEGKIYNRK
jgi:hypothetical protein